jgi:hypothetical protein
MQDLSKDITGIVATNEEWHERRSEDRTLVHHFTASNCELIHVVAPFIGEDSSSFGCFRLLFTDKLFSVILTETNHDYPYHIKKGDETLQADITVHQISFHSPNNFDGS